MNYELILTEKCTRKCSFCYVKQTAFFATYSDIDKFYNEVVELEKNNTGKYIVSLFGGEPLLNFDVMRYCIEKFNAQNCEIRLYTNADLINKLNNYRYLNRIKIFITTYDIFFNTIKYINISQKFKNVNFSYTFTENDIDRVDEFSDICSQIGVPYKISFSHSLSSWENISKENLISKIKSIYLKELTRMVETKKISNLMMKYVGRIFELLYNPNIKEYFCLDTKKTFYNGKFIGSCIQCKERELNPRKEKLSKCSICMFKTICFKSCVAEYIDGEVPEKLCIFEKTAFNTVFDFITVNDNFRKIKDILISYRTV